MLNLRTVIVSLHRPELGNREFVVHVADEDLQYFLGMIDVLEGDVSYHVVP